MRKMDELVLLILEKVLEAIYFSVFLIVSKNIKNKRLLFIAIMIFEYLALKHFIKYNVWFQIIYTFMSFVNLKVLYKDKAQVTDIFLFMASSIILIVLGFLCGMIQILFGVNHYFLLIINRIMMFIILFLVRKYIKSLYCKYCSFWNRHTKNNKIKSLTLRNISIIVFNLMFYVINIGLIYIILRSK